MTTEEMLVKVAENREKLYEAGKQAEYDAFWDTVQNYGNRTTYAYIFTNWNCEYIRPKYKVVPTGGGLNQIFSWNGKLKKVEAEYFDFSQNPTPTAASSGNYYTFYNCVELEEIEDIGLSAYFYSSTFGNNYALHTIARLPFREDTIMDTNVFRNCQSLENLTIDGVIPTNFDIRYSTKLTHDSLMSIINALKDYSADTSGTTYTLTIGGKNVAKLSTEELQIIRSKGWKYA